MRICYCEDEAAQAEFFKKKVLFWAAEKNINIIIDIFASAEEYLFKADNDHYDAVFLDIAMKKMNGMELARQIRVKDKNVVLVFVTSDPGYVFDGYEVGAYRYLMKPIHDEKLYEILEYVRTNSNVDNSCIIVRTDHENQRIMLCDLLYIEVQGHYVNIRLVNEKVVTVKMSFAEILSQADSAGGHLVQTHRSYAVRNCEKITFHFPRASGCII